ncbi:hypothetical protein BGW80DRAFT_151531 [Lactifluus volemus]|nr:hypothetical protein BGW80DRAFT_151531 [Lactifluus volemus]
MQNLVAFQAPRLGNFRAFLKITLVDKLRPDDQDFTVTRELRGRAILPGDQTSNGDTSETVTAVRLGCEGTGITVSPEPVLEFLVERPQSDIPFATQTRKLVINKSSLQPLVSFVAATLRSRDSVAGLFSAKFEGDSMRIKPNRQRTVTVSFTPQRDGLYDAVLELTFYDRKREAEFVVERTLCGVARSLLSNNDNEDLSSDEEEVFLDSDDTGISVSDEDGVDLGIVERKQPDGPFDTLTTSLTIRNAEGSPSVILLKARIKTTDESEPSFAVSFDGGFHPIHPGAESTVHITFRPKFAGFFQEILTLVFYDSQRSARFIVVRTLQGTAGSDRTTITSNISTKKCMPDVLWVNRYHRDRLNCYGLRTDLESQENSRNMRYHQ